jgi:hypothetical protein
VLSSQFAVVSSQLPVFRVLVADEQEQEQLAKDGQDRADAGHEICPPAKAVHQGAPSSETAENKEGEIASRGQGSHAL